ncbi:MAG TPA: hypothetical protein VKY26_03670 [Actinomycetota bacterium]|nr:hypothetical protein [Actinomycetota bacterium]
MLPSALAILALVLVFKVAPWGLERLQGLPPLPPAGFGEVQGRLGPIGASPTPVTLVFTREEPGALPVTIQTAVGREYRVRLAPGLWDVRSTDGRACANEIPLNSQAWQWVSPSYPSPGC